MSGEWTASGQPKENPVLARWAEVLARRGAAPAVFDERGKVLRTFEQIEEEADGWAEKFSSMAFQTTALQTGNSPHWPALLLGLWRCGHAVVPLDLDFAGERQERAERLCGISLRVVSSKEGLAVERTGQAPREWLDGPPDLLKLTSGTTSEPRAIRFKAAQLLADCDNICDTMGLREEDRNYGAISFAHSYGFSNLVTPLLCRGIPLVAATDLMPRALAEGLAQSGATVFPAVPAIFRALSALCAEPGGLRLCISAGALLGREVAEAFHRSWGRKIHSFYGASECGGMCYDAGEDPCPAQRFVGAPLQGVNIRSLGGEPSQIEVSSAAVALGYHPAESGERLGGGVFRPPDLLEWTGSGYVLTGRLSEAINVAGRKVNPHEIERLLRRFPGVREAIVLGLPATARGEEVAACVVGRVAEGDLRAHAARNLPSWQVPRRWAILAELPVNARGKTDRAALEKLFE